MHPHFPALRGVDANIRPGPTGVWLRAKDIAYGFEE